MLLLCLLKCLAFLLLCQLLFFFFSSRKIITQVTTILGFTIPAVPVTVKDIIVFLIPLGVTAIKFCIRRANGYAQLTGKLPIDISSCSVGGLPHPQRIPTGHVAELGFLTGAAGSEQMDCATSLYHVCQHRGLARLLGGGHLGNW